jgi:hypothetical protein
MKTLMNGNASPSSSGAIQPCIPRPLPLHGDGHQWRNTIPTYYRTIDGIVSLKGRICCWSVDPISTIAILPIGYRPPVGTIVSFECRSGHTGTVPEHIVMNGRAVPHPHYPDGNERWVKLWIKGDDGTVNLRPDELGSGDSDSDDGINLDGISFPTAPLSTVAPVPAAVAPQPIAVAIATPVAVGHK